MDTTILQVPIRRDLRDKAAIAAKKLGFSSLQECIRFFLQKLVEGKVHTKIEIDP